MRHATLKFGRIKLVLIITVIAVLLAMTTDILLAKILNHEIIVSEALLRAAIIPLLIAPFISWYLVGLLFELDHLEQKMSLLATYDDLTGLLNRRAFFDSCNVLHEYSMRNRQNYSLLSVDIDFFKKINDQYGHASGDEVLKSFGRVTSELSRKSDVAGRLGGEEFVFFLANTNLNQARDFAHRLSEEIKLTKVENENDPIAYTVSIGIAINRCDEDSSLEETLKRSDKALYTAKNNGRNQVVIYEPA